MSNDNNAGSRTVFELYAASRTVFELFEEKLANAKKKFAPEIFSAGLTADIDEIEAIHVMAHLIANKLAWSILEGEQTALLIDLVEAGKTEKNAGLIDGVLRIVRGMPEERIRLLWRYVKFFLNCTKAAQGN